ncbi:hypothetical protein CISIN_1g035468mg [Citrus sinensis]|uniref:Uncharacterized protein n=1 Tax=Citrus sinensis TaxID=2711 RepID=A0A067EQ99_CITSI|nr:hypothetical protein CISIN_1g035468mg [Citrus sinensis]
MIGIQKQINPYNSVDPFSGGFSKRLIVDGFEFKYRNLFTPYVYHTWTNFFLKEKSLGSCQFYL